MENGKKFHTSKTTLQKQPRLHDEQQERKNVKIHKMQTYKKIHNTIMHSLHACMHAFP